MKNLNIKSIKNTADKKATAGITLIALVLTIIVLLILAGVSIATLTGDNGILTKAAKAREETKKASIEEQRRLAMLEAAVNLENQTYIDINGDTATIPAGFAPTKIEGEDIIENGLVVIDSKGNEFVWVPVNNINRMVMCKSKTADTQCSIELNDSETALICTVHDDSEDICGKLYRNAVTGEVFEKDFTSQEYNDDYVVKEPALVSDNDTLMDSDIDGNELSTTYLGTIGLTAESFESEMNTMFKEMALSVALNGGFYVGRYELSLSDDGNAVSKRNSVALVAGTVRDNNTYYRWYGLYDVSKKYVNSKNNVKSSMIWGSQYDTMMLWMIDSGLEKYVTSTNTPNGGIRNEDSTYTGPEGDTDIINNIYDLYGGRLEWTLEANYTRGRVYRSGWFDGELSLNNRFWDTPNWRGMGFGTRLTLYIQ